MPLAYMKKTSRGENKPFATKNSIGVWGGAMRAGDGVVDDDAATDVVTDYALVRRQHQQDKCVICLRNCFRPGVLFLNCECRYAVHYACYNRWHRENKGCLMCRTFSSPARPNTYRVRWRDLAVSKFEWAMDTFDHLSEVTKKRIVWGLCWLGLVSGLFTIYSVWNFSVWKFSFLCLAFVI